MIRALLGWLRRRRERLDKEAAYGSAFYLVRYSRKWRGLSPELDAAASRQMAAVLRAAGLEYFSDAAIAHARRLEDAASPGPMSPSTEGGR